MKVLTEAFAEAHELLFVNLQPIPMQIDGARGSLIYASGLAMMDGAIGVHADSVSSKFQNPQSIN